MFFKKLYKDYVIVIESKGKYVTYNYDRLLMKYINNKDINYIIVKSDYEVIINKCNVNNYNKYLIIEYIIKYVIKHKL